MNETLEKSARESTEKRQLRAYIDDLLSAGIQPSRIAVESGVSLQRLKAWINGSGGENVVPDLLTWQAEVEKAATAQAQGFVQTPTSQKIIRAFDRARLSQGGVAHADGEHTEERGIALVYGASGVGKTEAAEWYRTQHLAMREVGTWPVVIVRCTGRERDAASLHAAILNSMTGAVFYKQLHENKIDAIRARVPEGGILIFDEAQLLAPRRLPGSPRSAHDASTAPCINL